MRADELPAKAGQVLEAVLFRGELPRRDVPALVGTGDRQARRVVSALLKRGILSSASTREPLTLTCPAALAPRWMPACSRSSSVERRAHARPAGRVCAFSVMDCEVCFRPWQVFVVYDNDDRYIDVSRGDGSE